MLCKTLLSFFLLLFVRQYCKIHIAKYSRSVGQAKNEPVCLFLGLKEPLSLLYWLNGLLDALFCSYG